MPSGGRSTRSGWNRHWSRRKTHWRTWNCRGVGVRNSPRETIVVAMPLTKVSVGKAGLGAAHASYITRLSALDPDGRERTTSSLADRGEQPSLFDNRERMGEELTVSATLDANLSGRALNHEGTKGAGPRDVDPIWTWNAPGFLTGEGDGTRPEWTPNGCRSDGQTALKEHPAV